jgi:hypothetical protein
MNLSKFLGVPSLRKFGEFLRRVSIFFILFISGLGVGGGGKLAEVIFSICAASEILLTTLLSRLVSTDRRAGYWSVRLEWSCRVLMGGSGCRWPAVDARRLLCLEWSLSNSP